MMLIDVSKLDWLRVGSDGLFRIKEHDSKDVCRVVRPPVKVKLAPDVLIVCDAKHACDTRVTSPCISISTLKSTKRKFEDQFVQDVINKVLKSNDQCTALKVLR